MKAEVDIPVSVAELLDKISILEIKVENIRDKEKLRNINFELDILRKIQNSVDIGDQPYISRLQSHLKEINKGIWNGEDIIRDLDRHEDFGENFINAARSIRRLNDERAQVKREINNFLGSRIIEEKDHGI